MSRTSPMVSCLLSLSLLLVACDPKGDDSDSGATDDAVFSNLTSEVADVATVLRVRWTTETATQGYVSYGLDGAFDLATPVEAEAATDHEMLLLGLPANASVDWKVVIEGDAPAESQTQTATTGGLPSALPGLTATGSSPGTWNILTFLGGVFGPVILDAEGRIVWYQVDDSGLDVYRAILSRDGTSVIYNAGSIGGDPADDSHLTRVSLDGSSRSEIPIPLLAHDFVELPDGNFGAIAVKYGDLDGTEVRGEAIVESDEAGNVTEIWNSWDCFDPAVDIGDDQETGWTFANALDYDPVEDVYYLGMRNFSSIVRVDRATGTCDWVFGRTASTITLEDGSDMFLHQHQFELAGNRLRVFDNEGSTENESRMLEYEMDFVAGTARQTWSYSADPMVKAFVLGEVTTLDDTDIIIDWASGGQINRISSDGEVEWQVNVDLGYIFGFDTVVSSLYAE